MAGPDGTRVDGMPGAGPQDRSWQLEPRAPWAAGAHRLVIDPVLEDLAGNSARRGFDRDLGRREDDPRAADFITVSFQAS